MEDREKRKANGKARQEEDLDLPAASQNGTLASRIFSSASGLARDAFKNSGNDLSSEITSSSTLGGKVQGSSSSPNAQWQSTVGANDSRVASGQQQSAAGLRNGEKFRSTSVQQDGVDQFEEFQQQRDQPSVKINSENASSWIQQFQRQAPNPNSAEDYNNPIELYTGSHIPGLDDGAEVRGLLSDPSFFAGTDEAEVTEMQEISDSDVADLFPQNFSADEAKAAKSIRSALPPAPTHKPMPADHPLNLRPSFESSDARVKAELQHLAATLESTGPDGALHFSDSAQQEHWLREWADVLNGYTDEVWGNVLLEVRAAKIELEEILIGTKSLDSKALSRLKMILNHTKL